jgi:hypothetical protein
MAGDVESVADTVCGASPPCSPPFAPDSVTFVQGDLTLGAADDGSGMLFVTGELTLHGDTAWTGLIFVIGEGRLLRSGAGNGAVSGAIVVANISGPDGTFGTGDDCSGGVAGLLPVTYDETAGGDGDNVYCSSDVADATPVRPYDVAEFLQR